MKAQIQKMTKTPVNAAAADAQRCVTCNAPRIVLSDLGRNVHSFGESNIAQLFQPKLTSMYVTASYMTT